MSATHVQDPAINERRLRPIYDHLDVGNNKKALQEADKVLKKYPAIQCARALKALVLLRLGREDEAANIVEKLAAEQPTDEGTLQVMTYCYKDQEELDKICDLYGNAVRQVPGNEDLLSHLFMAHVRVNNYASQQTVALQLFRLNPKNPYFFWAVMSIVLKSQYGADSADAAKSRLLLALAQRMIDNHIADNRMDAEQEVQLYLNVLKLQGKHAEALAFIESELGQRLYPGAPVSLRIDAMRELARWADLEALVRDLLKDNRERWDYYKEFVQCAVELHRTADGNLATVDIAQLRPYKEYIDHLITVDAIRIRGPYLGRLLLYKTLQQQQFAGLDALFDGVTMLQLLVEYFQLFGQKPCCTNDIQMFLECLSDADRAGLAESLLRACNVSSTAVPQSRDQMQQHICTLQISRICGAHELGAEHLNALYMAFSLHYEHGMTAYGMNLLPTDMGPSDAYALLAAHVMYDLALKLCSSAPLVEALCLLNYVLSNSPSNFHAKLLCLQIYHRLGCGWGAHKTYETLDVKHVQLDSMGYLHASQLPTAGIPTLAKPLYDQTLKFFTASYKESLEYLSMCYRFGSFSKLQEFMEFRDRLTNSLHYSMIAAETLLGEMVGMSASSAEQLIASVSGFNLDPQRDRTDKEMKEFTDNRDLSVVVRWDVAESVEGVDGIQSKATADRESFRQDVQLFRLRSFMLRMIGGCVDVYDTPDDRLDALATVTYLRQRWTKIMGEVRGMYMLPVSAGRLANLLPSRLHGILRQPFEAFFEALLRLVLALEEDGVQLAELNASEDALLEVLRDVELKVRDSVEANNESEDKLWGRRDVQEVLVNCLEMIALGSLVLAIVHDKFKSLCATKGGRKTKQKLEQQQQQNGTGGMTDRDRLGAVSSVVGIMQSILAGMDQWIADWEAPLCPDNLVERISAMSLNPNVEPVVQTTLRDGHRITVQELRVIIKEKQRMLRGRD